MATTKTAKRFFGTGYLTNSAGTVLYTPPGTTAIATISVIKFIHISNPSASAVTFRMSIEIPSVSVDGAQARIFDGYSIAAGTVFNHCCYYPILGATVSLGAEYLAGYASTNNVLTCTVSGDFIEIS